MKKKILILFLLILSITIDNCISQWITVSNGIENKNIECMTACGSSLFAGTSYNGIYITTNNGASWTLKGLSNRKIYSLSSNGSTIFAGIDTGIVRSTDNGNTWTFKNSFGQSAVSSIATSGYDILVSAQNLDAAGIYRSTDNGNNWAYLRGVISNHTQVAINQNYYYVSTGNSMPYSIYTSVDFGNNWSYVYMYTFGLPYCIGINNNYVFLGTQKCNVNDSVYGLCISSDNGNSWTMSSLFKRSISAITVSGNNIIAGTKDSGVYISTNNGQSWSKRNEGLPASVTINTLYIYNGYLYAGVLSQSVWKRQLSELITGITTVNNSTPVSYALNQNYPNPFNPETNIKYNLKDSRMVSLKIFDVLGKEITSLVNEKQVAGTYEVNFNASNITSGIYFYSLYIDGVRFDTKKMVLLK